MTVEEYLKEYPEAARPTFCGEQADRGRILVGRQFPKEGYAVLHRATPSARTAGKSEGSSPF
jgi:hypothetical protein